MEEERVKVLHSISILQRTGAIIKKKRGEASINKEDRHATIPALI